MKKVCELLIYRYEDRAELAKILVIAGYIVSMEERETPDDRKKYYGEKDFWIIVHK